MRFPKNFLRFLVEIILIMLIFITISFIISKMYERFFTWDEHKAIINWRKHRISFKVVPKIFYDPNFCFLHTKFENGEIRWHGVGYLQDFGLIFVAYTDEFDDRTGDEIIRIISARRAEKYEQEQYYGNREL